jgi:hypothetical protein
MRTRAELALATLEGAHQTVVANVSALTINEALDGAAGYRSVLGILKHVAGWSHVYYSFAFEGVPTHWRASTWPRGLRDTVKPTQPYVREILAWFEASFGRWKSALTGLDDAEFDRPHACHWGSEAPLFDIVLMVANHWCYHAGEINEILSIRRGEAWEYAEEVEENHISTAGHRVRPSWMAEDQAQRYEAYLTMRDAELHGPRTAQI